MERTGENNGGEGRRERGGAVVHNTRDSQRRQRVQDERRCWPRRVPTIAEVARRRERRNEGGEVVSPTLPWSSPRRLLHVRRHGRRWRIASPSTLLCR